MILKLALYYALTIFALSIMVSIFSKRKAILISSAVFLVFFTFLNCSASNIILFFVNLQNFLVSVYDTVFDKVKILAENGSTNLIKRVGTFMVALIIALVKIKNTPVMALNPQISLDVIPYYHPIYLKKIHRSTQNINLIFERYNC